MQDLLIIGAGPGGYKTALHAAQHGLKVTIFEAGHVGGTCLNVGCIPTKTYVHSASFAEAIERQPQVVEQLRSGVETLLSHPNITLVREHATFVDAHTVQTHSGQRYTADNIIIATGSSTKWLNLGPSQPTAPSRPPRGGANISSGISSETQVPPRGDLEGAISPRERGEGLVVDSTGLLSLKELPRRLCIIGAGVIGMEFASVFRHFGSEVTVVEFLKECLPAIDADIAKRLRKVMEKQGVKFYMGAAVKEIRPLSNSPRGGEDSLSSGEKENIGLAALPPTGGAGRGASVLFEQKGKELSVEADVVLMATGRKPNTEGLNLEALGITLERNGAIPVDEHFEVAPSKSPRGGTCVTAENPEDMPAPPRGGWEGALYAIGDVNGRQMLAHAAEFQGHHVVNRILGIEDHIRFDVMPAAIFTTPEAACVGPAEDQLKAAATPFECHKAFYRANGKALSMGETEGMVKLCCEPGEGRLLSCHAYGAHAADLVQEATAYITLGATLRQLRETVHIHPTLSEILIEVN
ncbi:MAG: NAD(P)/FAD-dependent oxidoreductase [Bacteroidaceae bacterium]|nr:NAD(P)/FAD-dependent oxidoreductase [Bacteroidaceae bacterium]